MFGEEHRMASATHREIERAPPGRYPRYQRRNPLRHERRRRIGILGSLAQALLTTVGLGFAGLVLTAILGLGGGNVSRHITFGIFSTMVILLAHSMMMFYLIGKGKAVKDAMAEGHLTGNHYQRVAAARKPVFSYATIAMAVTMVTAILGASVDTGVLPPIVHAMIAYGAIACNVAAVKIEIAALTESSRIVTEVNRLLGS
jgi:hypothetical protein